MGKIAIFLSVPFLQKLLFFFFLPMQPRQGGEEPIFCSLCSPVGILHPETRAVPPQTLL